MAKSCEDIERLGLDSTELVLLLSEPKPVVYGGAIESVLNYDYLISVAQTSDSGATLLSRTLSHIGLTDPPEVIAKAKQALEVVRAEREDMRRNDVGRKENNKSQLRNNTGEFIGLSHKLATWETNERRLKLAQHYCAEHFNISNISDLYDKTEKYEDNSSLLAVMHILRNKVPKPRRDIRGPSRPSLAEDNVVAAERIVRILILEEAGEISLTE